MTNREFYLSRRAAELPAFLAVLNALPEDKLAYTPHERSPSAAQIGWTLACEQRACCELAETGHTEWAATPPQDARTIIEQFEQHDARLRALVSQLDDAAWLRPAQFFVGGRVAIEQPLGELLWFFLFDAIHHRGQLSTYIRPMGGKVPAICGPSGDSAQTAKV